MFKVLSVLVLAVVLGLGACRSMPKIDRTDVNEEVDFSGEWNDTDSRQVSEEMISDVVARSWIEDFVVKKSKKPRVIVGTIVNKSHEHINTETFVKDLERSLINSGKVRFVASKIERDEVREEREDQQTNASAETKKEMYKEHGADFMLRGQINTIFDGAGKMQVKYYQVELELIDMQTNEKAWMGQKKIKKVIKYPKKKF